MIVEEYKRFLIKQRERGRTGCVTGVDKSRTSIEKRRLRRLENEEKRKRKLLDNPTTSTGSTQNNFFNIPINKTYPLILL